MVNDGTVARFYDARWSLARILLPSLVHSTASFVSDSVMSVTVLALPTSVATRQPTLLVSRTTIQSINALCRLILSIAYRSVIMSYNS
jgi:hypothetical protein